MTDNQIIVSLYVGSILTAVVIYLVFQVLCRIEDRLLARREPKTEDMLDEYARLAVARQAREKKTLARPSDAEAEIRGFLTCGPAVQLERLEEARKREYAYVTAAELVLKYDPEKSAARIAELEASIYPKTDPAEPTARGALASARRRRRARS